MITAFLVGLSMVLATFWPGPMGNSAAWFAAGVVFANMSIATWIVKKVKENTK